MTILEGRKINLSKMGERKQWKLYLFGKSNTNFAYTKFINVSNIQNLLEGDHYRKLYVVKYQLKFT